MSEEGQEGKRKKALSEALERLSGKRVPSVLDGDDGGPREYAKPGDGFLWKPSAEKSGRLVVLMPQKYGGQVKRVALMNQAGKVLEQGKSSGYANGNREHFRFSRGGAAYPNGTVVEVEFSSGKKIFYRVDNTANRLS